MVKILFSKEKEIILVYRYSIAPNTKMGGGVGNATDDHGPSNTIFMCELSVVQLIRFLWWNLKSSTWFGYLYFSEFI